MQLTCLRGGKMNSRFYKIFYLVAIVMIIILIVGCTKTVYVPYNPPQTNNPPPTQAPAPVVNVPTANSQPILVNNKTYNVSACAAGDIDVWDDIGTFSINYPGAFEFKGTSSAPFEIHIITNDGQSLNIQQIKSTNFDVITPVSAGQTKLTVNNRTGIDLAVILSVIYTH